MNDEIRLEKYANIAQTLIQEKGPFKLFALLELSNMACEWDVVLSASWLPGNDKMESLRFIVDKIRAVLTHQEYLKIARVILLDVNEPFVKELQNFLQEHNNPKTFSSVEIEGVEIEKGRILISPVSEETSSELLTKTSKWVRQAAKQGDREAQNTLGLMYSKGEGVKQNLRLAKKWFKKAATLGHVQAQSNLEALPH
ncbi:Sel1 domain protein repeat-containing protein [Candidatus Thiomargarita nelsonii]|uniref:Sel1 domain protein repeat-containing protein n=1 Tax=Candidatus Thiomargarita nelsonii TaxID=1003181 RepID=A0A176S4V9_9GAMM|nr:Sel1 domain protein repeat-containing protein [Candidatus Thiomargarita nelsonii]